MYARTVIEAESPLHQGIDLRYPEIGLLQDTTYGDFDPTRRYFKPVKYGVLPSLKDRKRPCANRSYVAVRKL